jgi:hypothetical protein
MQEEKDTGFYPVVSVICRSPLIHVEVDFKLSLAPLSRRGLIFEPSGQEITQYLVSTSVAFRGGRSGYPKISGRVFRVFKISGFENRYPKLQRVLQYPKIRVPRISGSGSGIPELPELLCWLHKNTCTLLN